MSHCHWKNTPFTGVVCPGGFGPATVSFVLHFFQSCSAWPDCRGFRIVQPGRERFGLCEILGKKNLCIGPTEAATLLHTISIR